MNEKRVADAAVQYNQSNRCVLCVYRCVAVGARIREMYNSG